MNANVPEKSEQHEDVDPAAQEKIREFCYELALALRRITGRIIEDELEAPKDERDQAAPNNTK